MTVRTAEIRFDAVGQPGWKAIVRINPRSSVFDALIDSEGETFWQALGQVVLSWNFADEDGQRIPLPREVDSSQRLDLPIGDGVLQHLFSEFFSAVRASARLPKGSVEASATTSSTDGEAQKGE